LRWRRRVWGSDGLRVLCDQGELVTALGSREFGGRKGDALNDDTCDLIEAVPSGCLECLGMDVEEIDVPCLGEGV